MQNRIFKIRSEYAHQALYHYKEPTNSWLFLFGLFGIDLCIRQDAHQKEQSGSGLKCFEPTDTLVYLNGTPDAFKVTEIEWFQLQSSSQSTVQ